MLGYVYVFTRTKKVDFHANRTYVYSRIGKNYNLG